jgi:hypothetical protein
LKRWAIRLTKGLNLVVLPAMTIVAPTLPLVFQLGYGVVVLMIADRAVQEWRQPDARCADRVVAAFTVIGLVLSGVLIMPMLASAIYRTIQQPTTPFISSV